MLYCYYVPTINIFYADIKLKEQLNEICDELKVFVAKKLSGSDIILNTNEVSVRLIGVSGSGMLADVELEITAHAFEERIKRQDEICLETRKFLKDRLDVEEVRVWLLLPQLGHSWD